jgi:hypothetical protein
MSGGSFTKSVGDTPADPVLLGRNVDVSIPVTAATNGAMVASALGEALREVAAYAKAGELVIDWSTLKVGIEVVDEGILPPLRIRARVHASHGRRAGA